VPPVSVDPFIRGVFALSGRLHLGLDCRPLATVSLAGH
jgi:hypothetical protein